MNLRLFFFINILLFITVAQNGAFADAPSAAISIISSSPQSPSTNDTVTCRVRMMNTGHEAIPAGAYFSFFDKMTNVTTGRVMRDNHMTSYNPGPAIAVGQNCEFNMTVNFQPLEAGEYRFEITRAQVTVDVSSYDAVCGAQASVSFTVVDTAVSDLSLSGLRITPQSPSQGDNVECSVSLTNQGDGTARNIPVWFELFRGGQQNGLQLQAPEIATLGHNASAQVSRTYQNVQADSYRLKVTADPLNCVRESSDNNNTQELQFVIRPPVMPTVAVSILSVNPQRPTTNDTVTCRVRMTNTGQEAISAGAYFSLFDKMTNVTTGRVLWDNHMGSYNPGPAIAAGQNCEYNMTVNFQPLEAGEYHFEINRAQLTIDRALYEVVCGNSAQVTFTVEDAAVSDLTVSGLRIMPAAPSQGDNVECSVSLTNQGDGTARNVPVWFELFRDGQQNGLQLQAPEIATLGHNASAQVSRTFQNVQAGSYRLRCTVDPLNRVRESSDNNNTQELQFVIRPPAMPTMSISIQSVIPERPRTTDTVTCRVRVANAGQEPIPAGAFFSFFDKLTNISTGRVISDNHMTSYNPGQAIAAGQNSEYTMTVNFRPLEAGEYRFEISRTEVTIDTSRYEAVCGNSARATFTVAAQTNQPGINLENPTIMQRPVFRPVLKKDKIR